MQQYLQKRFPEHLSEEPQMREEIRGKALTIWRLKSLFWGRNSITTALTVYGLTWWGLLFGMIYLLQAFHIDPGENSQYGRLLCLTTLIFGCPSLISAYITAKISPKWSTFAVGISAGGFLGYVVNDIIYGMRNGDSLCNFSSF
jgi:hypothetical protein